MLAHNMWDHTTGSHWQHICNTARLREPARGITNFLNTPAAFRTAMSPAEAEGSQTPVTNWYKAFIPEWTVFR